MVQSACPVALHYKQALAVAISLVRMELGSARVAHDSVENAEPSMSRRERRIQLDRLQQQRDRRLVGTPNAELLRACIQLQGIHRRGGHFRQRLAPPHTAERFAKVTPREVG